MVLTGRKVRTPLYKTWNKNRFLDPKRAGRISQKKNSDGNRQCRGRLRPRVAVVIAAGTVARPVGTFKGYQDPLGFQHLSPVKDPTPGLSMCEMRKFDKIHANSRTNSIRRTE